MGLMKNSKYEYTISWCEVLVLTVSLLLVPELGLSSNAIIPVSSIVSHVTVALFILNSTNRSVSKALQVGLAAF